MSSTTPFAAAAPPLIEPASRFTAALLFLTPLLLSAYHARAGLGLGVAVLATLLLLQALLHLIGAAQRRRAFAATLWSGVTVALASWFLSAYGVLDRSQVALLPLIAANAAWWQTHRTRSAIALGVSSLALAVTCIAIGLLRRIVDALAPDESRLFVSGLAQWLASPPGLAISAAMALALWQHVRPSPAAAPERDIDAP